MNTTHQYKLDRYKAAFVDYGEATRNFNDIVIALTKDGCTSDVSLDALIYELEVKHRHFVECANRLICVP